MDCKDGRTRKGNKADQPGQRQDNKYFYKRLGTGLSAVNGKKVKW